MPSSYTSDLYEGKDVTFRDFVLGCARGMGALIHMRDDPWDAPIRYDEPSAYYVTELDEARAQLEALYGLTNDEADAEAQRQHDEALTAWRERRDRRNTLRARYQAMLREVDAWTPPTPEHEGLKQLMREQLHQAIDFDCSTNYDATPPTPTTGSEWRRNQVHRLKERIVRYEAEGAKEQERVTQRNQWIDALMTNLPAPASVR